jgi:hypothetical protein
MTDLDREAIRARADAATKGPWSADGTDLKVNTTDGRALIVLATVLLGDDDSRENHPQARTDAEFIAATREDVPALLDVFDRIREIHRPAIVRQGTCADCGQRYPCPTVQMLDRPVAAAKGATA